MNQHIDLLNAIEEELIAKGVRADADVQNRVYNIIIDALIDGQAASIAEAIIIYQEVYED